MRKRGFTLIELLAVIVVIGIIALIATPMVLNTIEESRRGAAGISTESYIKAIETKVAAGYIKNEEYENKDDYVFDEIPVDIKGTKPVGGIYTLENGVVTSGTFCVNGYEVKYQDNESIVGEKCTAEDVKLNGSVKLSEYSGLYTYPISGTFEVIENISGGALTCETSDSEVADCSITGTTVTITPGKKDGDATITITSEGSSKYKKTNVAYLAHTEKGLLSVSANGYTGVYDGEAHGITVSSENAIIMYGTIEGTYDLETNPTYINAGIYTVYYQVTRAGYNTVTGSKTVIITKAEGKLLLEETTGTISHNEIKNIIVKENNSNEPIIVSVNNEDIVEASIVEDKLVIKGKTPGVTKITLSVLESTNYSGASTEYAVTVIKANNELALSSITGNYTYPESGTFEVTKNTSGGELSCRSSNTNIATCSIEGTTVTVTPGTTAGDAILTITSTATTNYNSAQVAYVVTTSKGSLQSYTANGYTGIYDGNPHGITVTSSGSTITYGETEGNYTLTSSPTYKDVGTYTVYYKIEKPGYNVVTGNRVVTITKAAGSVVAPTGKTLTYTGSAQELVNAGSTSTGTLEYKLEGGTYSTSIPTAINDGTYKIYYRVVGDNNHTDVAEAGPITVTIEKAILSYTTSGYSGIYDGALHGITVISNGATIKYRTTSSGEYTLTENPTYSDVGEYTVYYEITRTGYITVTGSEKVTITKANNTLILSTNVGSYTYPTSGKFEVTKNTSGGTLSCKSSNTAIATCTIAGTTVTVTPGTTKGDATITVTSAATTNYKEAQVAHVATTQPGLLSVSASDYTGTYDGKAHGITVTSSGATIKYSEASGTYNLDTSPTLTDVGTKTVYYQVTKAGYTTVTGSKTITITKANGTVTAPTAKTITYTGSAQALINAGSSSTGEVQYKLSGESYSTSIPTGTAAGTYTVCYKVVGDNNHNDVAENCSIKVTIGKATNPIAITASQSWSATFSTSAQTKALTGATGAQGSVTYAIQSQKNSSGTTVSSFSISGSTVTMAASTAPGTYTVVVRSTAAGNSNYNSGYKDITLTVTVGKANNTLTLSANTATYTYPNAGTFTVSKNTSGGTLSCSSSNTNIATCSISGTTVTVTPGTTKGDATITITSAATTNYNSATASHVATTSPGLLSVSANGYSAAYDGKAHGITVTSSGATIKYGATEGTYDLTSSPTYTDVGTYTVYYQVTKAGYTTVTGSKTVTISKATNPISVTASQTWSATFKTSAQTKALTAASGGQGSVTYAISSQKNSSGVAVTSFSLSGTTVTMAANTTVGTYTVVVRATAAGNGNYNSGYKDITLIVTVGTATNPIAVTASQSWSATFSTSAQTKAITAATGNQGTVTYSINSNSYFTISGTTVTMKANTPVGTHTLTITATAAGNTNYASGSKTITLTVTVGKASNTLTLSSNAATYTYPNSGTFTVSKNTSGGALSCASSNTAIATCSISGSTVTVTPGTTKGNATLTITSAATTNYNSAQVAHVATTEPGIQSCTANGYSGTYDGKAHGITVTCSGSTIKYGESSGSYTLTSSPTYTNAGTYTVYYQVTRTGYTTVTGSKTVTISKANNPISVAGKSLTYTGDAQALATVSGAQGNVCYSTSSAPTSCSSSGTIPTGTNAGSYTVYYYVAGNTNYNSKSGSVTASIAKKADSISITAKTATYSGSAQKATFSTTSGLTPTVTYYSNSSCSTAVSGSPVNAGTYYAKATTAGNTNYNAASLGCTKAVTINKAANPIAVTASQTWSVNFSTSAQTKAITAATGNQGTVSYAISSNSYFTISGTTVTMKAGTTAGTYTVTITATAAGNTNYASGSKTITLTVTVADKTAPSVPTSVLRYDSSSGTVRTNANSWTNKTLWWGSFSSTDTGGSSIARYEYSTGCSGTVSGTLSTSHTYSSNTNYTFCIRAVDTSGNASGWSSAIYIKVDKTAPTAPSITNPTNGNWTNADFSLSATTTESGGSGVSYWQYSYNNSSWTTYSSSAATSFKTTPFSAERNQLAYLRACDSAGNCSSSSSTYIRIDKTAPVLSGLTNSAGDKGTTGTITVKYNVAESGSGIKQCQYQYASDPNGSCGGVWCKDSDTLSGGVFTATYTAKRKTTAYHRCIDNAGNASNSVSTLINICSTYSCTLYKRCSSCSCNSYASCPINYPYANGAKCYATYSSSSACISANSSGSCSGALEGKWYNTLVYKARTCNQYARCSSCGSETVSGSECNNANSKYCP